MNEYLNEYLHYCDWVRAYNAASDRGAHPELVDAIDLHLFWLEREATIKEIYENLQRKARDE